MFIKKLTLGAIAVALMLCANLRLSYSVELDGSALEGRWTALGIFSAARAANAAASEVSRESTCLPEYGRTLRVGLAAADGDALELTFLLLGQADGVQEAYRVDVGGVSAGVTSDPSALGEVLETILASGSSPEAVTVDFAQSVELSRVFIPDGRYTDLMELSGNIRALTPVVSTLADGRVVYG